MVFVGNVEPWDFMLHDLQLTFGVSDFLVSFLSRISYLSVISIVIITISLYQFSPYSDT